MPTTCVPPTTLKIHSVQGDNASKLNGVYELRKEHIGGRPSYVKVNTMKNRNDQDPMVIWFWEKKKVWMMNKTSMIHTDSAFACVRDPAADPTKIMSTWKVYDKTQGVHCLDEKMEIGELSSSEIVSELNCEKLIQLNTIKSLKERIDALEIEIRLTDRKISEKLDEKEEIGFDLECRYNQLFLEYTLKKQKYQEVLENLKHFKETNEILEKKIFYKESEFTHLNELIKLSKIENNKIKLKKFLIEQISKFDENQLLSFISTSSAICNTIVQRHEEFNSNEI